GGVMYQCLAYYAAHFTSATNMGVIQALIPLLALALSRVFMGHPVRGTSIAGAVISTVGVVAVVSQGDLARLAATSQRKKPISMGPTAPEASLVTMVFAPHSRQARIGKR
ncbi:EamA family transporter, partial [Burkholderia sp. BCCIQ04B]|uniref:EamA family transporter n=1 Tax=Burkholderia anthinoferrum TaxID=3090833 RepID=UPI002B248F1D